jgi:hypothetical protein
METSLEIKNIAKALKEFHELTITITKDATNPHFHSKFASLDNIIETIRIPLASRGLAFSQFPDGDGLTTILLHSPSGEWMKATANLKLAKEDPQGQGSAYTYHRRYALAAMLGLATEDDDDGNEASKAPVTAKTAQGGSKPAAAKKDAPSELDVQKERVWFLLKALGMKANATKNEATAAVFEKTKLHLTDENLPAIAETLAAQLEAKEAAAEQ